MINASLSYTFRSLKNPNFKLYFFGQAISVIGTWMQMVTINWLVYRLTNSEIILGSTLFISQLPAIIISPFAGVILDRVNKYRFVLITQILAMLQSLVLTVLTVTDNISIPMIIMLNTVLNIINAADVPARQSLISDLLDKKDDLINAIGLNSSVFNLARIIGPSIAGLLLLQFDEGICFGINTVSFMFVIVSLLKVKVKKIIAEKPTKNVLLDLAEGTRYVFKFKSMKAVILLMSAISIFGMGYNSIMPAFAKIVLHGSSKTYGFLIGSLGLGALVSAISLASSSNKPKLGFTISYASFVFGLGFVLFGLSRNQYVSMIILFFTGFGMVAHMSGSNTLLQTITDEKMRGRVMSFYSLSFRGFVPFGNLFVGYISGNFSPSTAIIVCGLLCMFSALYYFVIIKKEYPYLCKVYELKGMEVKQ